MAPVPERSPDRTKAGHSRQQRASLKKLIDPRLDNAMHLDLDSAPSADSAVITIRSGNLDARNVREFKEALQPHLDAHRAVVLDMSQLDFVDSSGLGALLSSLRVMNNKDGELKLCAMTKPVLALFELVRMHRLFAIYNSREEALATLRNGPVSGNLHVAIVSAQASP